jgi:hypothetical protein
MSQRARRWAVVAAFVGFPLQSIGYVAFVERGPWSSAIWAPITLLLFAVTLVGVVAVYGYGQGRLDRRQRLDERQRTMLDRSLVVSYSVLTTVVVAIVAGVALYLSFVGPITLEMAAFTPWVIAVGLYVPFLPFAALAWLEPNAPRDDDDR